MPASVPDDPADRVVEMLRMLNASYLQLDPLYAMMRRDSVIQIPRRNMLREDQIFAVSLALAGPWAHLPQVLARRTWTTGPTTCPGPDARRSELAVEDVPPRCS